MDPVDDPATDPDGTLEDLFREPLARPEPAATSAADRTGQRAASAAS